MYKCGCTFLNHLSQYLKNSEYTVHPEYLIKVPVEKEKYVGGAIDLLVKLPSKYIIFDYKTTSYSTCLVDEYSRCNLLWPFNDYKQSKTSSYVIQQSFYMYALAISHGENAEEVYDRSEAYLVQLRRSPKKVMSSSQNGYLLMKVKKYPSR